MSLSEMLFCLIIIIINNYYRYHIICLIFSETGNPVSYLIVEEEQDDQ